MKIAVVGSGGREHALAHALGRTSDVVVTPGNAGMRWAGVNCAPAPPDDADLVVIGPEAPLVEGLADEFRGRGVPVFGPGRDGARLEGSKRYLKQVMHSAGVPTAASRAFTAEEQSEAEAFLESLPGLYVVKTDGLAAGKGVLVTTDLNEALDDLRAKLSGSSFGAAGTTVVIEEGMTGPELSVLAVCDGRPDAGGVVILPTSRDHKRVGDDDAGPNTGGMGAFSPVADAGADIGEICLEQMLLPTLRALANDGIDYRGVLYAGLMLTPDGPKLIEFNVRFGDPEAQVVLPRLDGDVAALLASAAAGRVDASAIKVRDDAAVGVVIAAPGYPEAPRTGAAIHGLDAAADVEGVSVYAAGVGDGPVTAGGRVLCVTALGHTIGAARDSAYSAVERISFDGGQHYRTDIAAV